MRGSREESAFGPGPPPKEAVMSVSGAVEVEDVRNRRQQLATIPEVAEELGIPVGSAYDLAREGRLPGVVRLGRRIRIRRDELDRWIAAGGHGSGRSDK
jgi:excisionase family DNA binding protein